MEQLYYGSPDFELAQFRDRRVMDEIRMVMTAFDCVLPDNSAIYCSGDVTTGKRLYELLKKYEVRSIEELKTRLGAALFKETFDKLVRANIERGIEFTENIRRRGHPNLINPGPFTAPGFEQQHYHYLWEWVIIKKVYEAQFNEGWEYSNGCTLEYAIATRKGIPRLDHLGNVLELAQALQKIERAVAELHGYGIQANMLERNLARLRELGLQREPQ
ncbi:MAG TPA: hypothetical protein VGX92_04815 [Pyrinomonadaceae bacterium]|jgi:hypothetical protein|nr:hypothetical protein [Pyrinomonadaceae bacterium]